MRIDTDHMEYFLAVVHHGTISKAAQALHVAQPAVSRKIKSLETMLGVALLERQPRFVTVTTAGQAYAQVFEQYLQAMAQLQGQYGRFKKETIRYGMFLGGNWPEPLKAYIVNFQKEHPHIQLIGTSEDVKGLREGLLSQRLDCIVALQEMLPNTNNLRQVPIAQVHRAVVYSKGNSLASRSKVTLADFKEQPCYMFRDEVTDSAKDMVAALFASYGLPAPIIRVVNNLDSVVMAFEQGDGFALLDTYQRIIHNSQFSYFELPETKIMYLAYTTEGRENPLLVQFIDGIKNALHV
ncbi:LysR family transcriptional regulator [Veillonella sp.]|uniref:LysR family transcriptional regulator n=1 Tax=Veillonella sp. TaxID=1926307 RepID=UPI0025E1108D|nr:LysR family transcriptional regulator [Veillonella sp.]